jgi:hypothetical protein
MGDMSVRRMTIARLLFAIATSAQVAKCELCVRASVSLACAFWNDRLMDRDRNNQWFPATLTAASFLATLSLCIVGVLDAFDGSANCQLEFAVGFGCALAFVSLLATPETCHRAVGSADRDD